MDLEFESTPARGLRRYVQRVADALNLSGGGYSIQLDEPVSAYLPLDGTLSAFPDADVALLWDHRRGWSAGIELDGGHQLIILCYHGADILPAPLVVARFAAGMFEEKLPGQPDPPELDTTDLLERLSEYAAPVRTIVPRW